MLIRYWLYLQKSTMLVLYGKNKAIMTDMSVFSVMVVHELVYEFPGGGIKGKYPQ